MKAFFDTNVYINTFFKSVLPREEFEKFFSLYEIVVCPVVKHELLLGTIHPKTKRTLERFFDSCKVLEAPSKKIWEDTTKLMKNMGWRENRQQNDVLIALTAKNEDATLVTYDRHFAKLRELVEFDWVHLHEK